MGNKITRRGALAGAAGFAAAPSVAKAFILRGGGGAAPAGGQIATLSLVNTSGSIQAANAITPVFGWAFKKGDIPSGTAPQFKVSGVVQPMSWGLQTFWSDGSLKFASFMLRCTTSIAGSGTLAIGVFNGGSSPTTSARTLAEIYSQNLVVNATAAPVQDVGDAGYTSGTYSSWLDSAANTGSKNFAQTVWLDGAAGKAWRIDTTMGKSGKAGAADNWLQCSHYVVSLTDAGGNLGGVRWLGFIRQPVYNSGIVNNGGGTGAYDRYFVGSSLGFTINGGAQTNVPWPFNTSSFTASAGVITTPAQNTYWCGSQKNGNIVPCYITGLTGSPPQLNTTSPFYVQQDASNAIPPTNKTIVFYTASDGSGTLIGSFPGGGSGAIGNCSGTINPMMVIQSFTRIGMATQDGKYNFFQGTGSFSADGTLRTQIDKSYFQSSQLIPPFDISLVGTIGDTGYFGAGYAGTYNVLWNPLTIGDFNQFQGDVGDHSDLGVLPNNAAIDFFVQSNDSERLTRFNGLSSSLTTFDLRDATTNTIVVLTSGTYTGMPSSVATTVGWGSGFAGGVQGFPNHSVCFASSDPEHKPQYAYWPYLRTGEMQFLDFLVEQANSGVLAIEHTVNAQNSRNLNFNFFTTATYGSILGGLTTAELRVAAWGFRDLAFAAGIYPQDPTGTFTYPTGTHLSLDGSQTASYLTDLMNASLNLVIATMNPANNAYGSATSYLTGRGCWLMTDQSRVIASNFGYMKKYMCFAICAAVACTESSAARTVAGYLATEMNWIFTNIGGWHLPCYNYYDGIPDIGNNVGNVSSLFTDQQHFGVLPINSFSAGSLSWGTSAPYFTISGVQNDYQVTNGDIFVPHVAITGLTAWTPYYVVNWSGTSSAGTFSLSATGPLGGSAIAIGSTGSDSLDWHIQARAAPPTIDSAAFGADYIPITWMAVSWMKALGIIPNITTWGSNMNSLVTDMNNRIVNTPGIGNTYISGSRYATQDHFV